MPGKLEEIYRFTCLLLELLGGFGAVRLIAFCMVTCVLLELLSDFNATRILYCPGLSKKGVLVQRSV